jgi:hypothetical protein
VCHPFPIPKIGKADMIRSMEGLSFTSALDLSMGYYHIKLDHDADDQNYVPLYSHGTWKIQIQELTYGYQDCHHQTNYSTYT